MVCGWCGREFSKRQDSKFCTVRCRQSHWRFGRQITRGQQGSTERRRFGFGDPPYEGKAHLYRAHPDYGGEVSHEQVISRLAMFDGAVWACSSDSLRRILELAPPEAKVGVWVRGERPGRSYRPLDAWEAVVYWGGRFRLRTVEDRVTNALVFPARPRTSDPKRVVGAKPAAYCQFIFDLVGAEPGDEFVDLYPGSGGVTRAWEIYSGSR